MSRLAAAALLAGIALPAFAQQLPPPLAYTQPLAPPAVRQVQAKLHDTGSYTGAVDGTWGPDSQSALEQFQQSHNLQVTGQMNPATAAALGLDSTQLLQLAINDQAPPPPPMRLNSDAIRNIQVRLRQLGFYNGPVDGTWGPGTQSAVSSLQQNRGLQPTGRLDAPTVTAMGLNPYNPGAPVN
jgi:peptidoglycan hydrolase-like protein with peptidoglycan-binding domain